MNLSKEQNLAINHILGPALILAVPGAGKTTVLVYRTYNLIKNHKVDPKRILSITFSKSSAKDMKERFYNTFSQFPSLVHFSTIHSFCYNLIREYAYMNRIKYTLIEDTRNPRNKYNLLKNIYFDLNKDYITEDKLDLLLNTIGYMKNMLISGDDYIKENKVHIDRFIDIYNIYEEYKKQHNLIDFDDMLTISLEILTSNKYLLEKYRSKYDFIQVDEGQDISKVQMEIIYLISEPNNNLFIVADDDQSIYRFRGAYPKGLFDFNKKYNNAKLFFMETNYRSSKNIVSTCNEFIKTNTQRYKKEIRTDNGFVEPINIIKVKTLVDQYKFIIKDIKNKDLSEICILYRNNISSVGIMETLERNNVPFYMKDTKLRFFNHWLVQDIINLMTFANNPCDLDLYEKFYYKIKGYISKKQIHFAKSQDHNLSVFYRILLMPDLTYHYRRTLSELENDFKRLSKLKPLEAIEHIEYTLEYNNYLKENSIKFGYTYDNLVTILNYLKLIAKETKNLREFLGRLKYLEYLSTSSKDIGSAITLSTIHSAKGLEFKRVYMVDLVDGEFPNSSSIESFERDNVELLEEERRLFYVGMTRAKEYLALLTMTSLGYKRFKSSRFLHELEYNS